MDNKSVYGKKLVDLAVALGLSQSEIASHLGIHRAHVHRWIHGVRPVPEHYRYPLIGLLTQNIPRYGQRLQIQVDLVQATGKARKALDASTAFCKEFRELIEELQLESASENAARALEALKAMPPGALYVSANATAIAEWATAILTYVNAFAGWSSLADFMKEGKGDFAFVRELAEPRNDDAASAVH